METKGTRSDQERRQYPRKACFFAEVDYAARDEVYTDSIKDISSGGVFIETDKKLTVGDDITMLFSDYARIDLIRITGDIIRKMPSGIVVKFNIRDEMKRKNMEKFVDMV